MDPPDILTALASEGKKLDVHLDVMAWDLLVVTLGANFAHAGSAWQPANAVAAQDARASCVRDFDFVIAR